MTFLAYILAWPTYILNGCDMSEAGGHFVASDFFLTPLPFAKLGVKLFVPPQRLPS